MVLPDRDTRKGACILLQEACGSRAKAKKIEEGIHKRCEDRHCVNDVTSNSIALESTCTLSDYVLYEACIRFAYDYCVRNSKVKKSSAASIVNNVMRSAIAPDEAKYRDSLVDDAERKETAMNLINSIGGGGESMRCRRCAGDNVACTMKQLRSMDEGMTSCFSCGDCGAKWRD